MPHSVAPRIIEPDITVVELSGRIALGKESNEIEPVVARLLAEGVRKLIMDISGVSYIDSAGMGQIAYTAGKVQQAGGKCFVAGAKGLVLDVFRITRIDTVVPFVTTVEEDGQGKWYWEISGTSGTIYCQ